MTGITTYLSILTLNVNRLNSPIKDTNWETRLKRKVKQSSAYRRPNHPQKQTLAENERLEENLPSQWPP
jgi:hypothetical protein